MAETTTFTGRSGATYQFEVYALSALGTFNDVQGVYVFASNSLLGGYRPLYIGETEHANQRLTTSHEKLPCVRRNGGTIICFMRTHTHGDRTMVEQDLIRAYNPVCNG